jgi:hypothetical protein
MRPIHPNIPYADAPNPFVVHPSEPGTATEADTVTLEEFARRRAARVRCIDPTLPAAMPEDAYWWADGGKKAKRGRKPGVRS